MRIYKRYLKDINKNNWPEAREVYVALDSQNKLGLQTWIVAVMGDGTLQNDTVRLGLFWKFKLAVHFARLYEEVISYDIALLRE